MEWTSIHYDIHSIVCALVLMLIVVGTEKVRHNKKKEEVGVPCHFSTPIQQSQQPNRKWKGRIAIAETGTVLCSIRIAMDFSVVATRHKLYHKGPTRVLRNG